MGGYLSLHGGTKIVIGDIVQKVLEFQDETRLLTKDEAYEQISHSASLFKAILEYVGKVN